MQRFIVALIALTALTLAHASGAFAADMAFPNFGKMPPPPMLAKAPPAPPATDWTGFYVGGDAGAAFANTPATWNPLPSAPAFGAFPISGHDRDTAFVGGGHAGYDYQFMPDWVGGIEGDWTWAKARGTLTQPWVAEPGLRGQSRLRNDHEHEFGLARIRARPRRLSRRAQTSWPTPRVASPGLGSIMRRATRTRLPIPPAPRFHEPQPDTRSAAVSNGR